jgi:putative membrane protein
MYALFSFLRYPEGAVIAITGAVGLYLLFRGLGLDDLMEETKRSLRGSLQAGKITFVTYILAAMLIVIATLQGAAEIFYNYRGPEMSTTSEYLTLIVVFINSSI